MQLEKDLIYVTRDIERALGLNPGIYGKGSYIIFTNSTPYSESIRLKYKDFVFTKKGDTLLDTYDLLETDDFKKILEDHKDSDLIVFKNTKRIEEFASKNKVRLLNPPSDLSEKVENKISQVEWLGEDSNLLPEHQILKVKDITLAHDPLIIQWAHSHTGDGTVLVNTKDELSAISQKFSEREARVTKYIKGPVFTQNISVDQKNIYLGNVSYQITGIDPFTDNPWSTVGNDWSYPGSTFDDKQLSIIHDIAIKVAKRMQKSGWRGLFGIDIIYDEERNEIKLLEINGRQPASTSYESVLQNINRLGGVEGLTIFEAHLLSLFGKDSMEIGEKNTIEINDGAQIIQRITKDILTRKNPIDLDTMISFGLFPIPYTNTKPNADLIRIQSLKGLIESHNKLNKRGQEIKDLLLK